MKKSSLQQFRTGTATAIISILICVTYITNPSFLKAPHAEAGAGQNVLGFAWSENIGWISFNNLSDGSATSYGVNISPLAVTGTGDLSGHAWSENIGWISFNRLDTGTPPFAPFNGATGPIAQVDWTTGKVTGWARAMSGFGSVGGWDGWIKLSDDNVGVWAGNGVKISLSTGKFSGYAWGWEVIGWIDFAPAITTNVVQLSSIPVASGTINVTSNIFVPASSYWTINGPATITGSGTSQTSTSQPTGTYTIIWWDVAGYTTPASQTFTLDAGGTIYFDGVYNSVAVNTSTSPTISINPTTYYSGVSNTYTFTATDPQGDQVRYGIDWNMDGTVDNWLPLSGYVNSGTSRSMDYTWPTTGNKQFQALTQDYQGLNSAWTIRNITVIDAPCVNNTINPPTCTQCGDNIAYTMSGYCVPCDNVGCSGTGGNSTNFNSTLSCNNGTINVPYCTVCPGGQTLVGGTCVNNCTNGATNPTACNTCPVGQELIGGTCTVTTTCGDNTCNGSETLLTCPKDCKAWYQQF